MVTEIMVKMVRAVKDLKDEARRLEVLELHRARLRQYAKLERPALKVYGELLKKIASHARTDGEREFFRKMIEAPNENFERRQAPRKPSSSAGLASVPFHIPERRLRHG